jgi:hypothetical protein
MAGVHELAQAKIPAWGRGFLSLMDIPMRYGKEMVFLNHMHKLWCPYDVDDGGLSLVIANLQKGLI